MFVPKGFLQNIPQRRANFRKTLIQNAQLAELVDASVSNTDRKLCRFDSGAGYIKSSHFFESFFV